MSSDTEIAEGLSAWLRDSLGPVTVPPQLMEQVAREVSATPQQRPWWPSRRPGPRSTTNGRRSPAMFAAIRVVPVVAAISMVALFVGVTLRVGPGWSTGPGAIASPSSGPAIVWDSGLVRLTASALRIHADGRTFTGEASDVTVRSDLSDGANRTLEVTWTEQDVEQRLYLYFAADEADWWVDKLRTYDGFCEPDWIHYTGPLFQTPLGQTFRGDVRLTGGLGRLRDSVQVTGSLEFDDLTIEVVEVGAAPPTAPPPAGETASPGPSATPGGDGPCGAPAPSLSADLGPADWWLDPDHASPDSDSVELHILVLERECASGASADGRIAEPVVDYSLDAVTITIGVRRRDGDQECPTNPPTPFTVRLMEPLGGRVLLDGGHARPVVPSPPQQ